MTLRVSEFINRPQFNAQVAFGMPTTVHTATFTSNSRNGQSLLRVYADGADHTITWANGAVEKFPNGTIEYRSVPAGTVVTIA